MTTIEELLQKVAELERKLLQMTQDRDDWREIARKLLKEKHVPQ